MSQLRPPSRSFSGFAPSTERVIDQRLGHARARKYSVAAWTTTAKERRKGTPTNILRRAVSMPDCHEMAKLRANRKLTQDVGSERSRGGGGLTRTRSVSFAPEILMFAAVAENDVTELRRILDEHDEVDINQQSPSGLTALHYAAAEGSLECLQELVARGVLLDVHDSQGCSPLDFAAKGGYFDCAALLVRAGAQIGNIINGVRWKPLINTTFSAWLERGDSRRL